jgi:hypothetical protein
LNAFYCFITWDFAERFGSLIDFTWLKTNNRSHAVLNRDGSIEMSYKELAARDAIVGIYPALSVGEKPSPVHFCSLTRKDGPFAVVYESFHYHALPGPQDLCCTIIKALGDKFDFLAYYSDLRSIARERALRLMAPVGGNITGIGQTQYDQTEQMLESCCAQGRFQLGVAQSVFVGSNEMQEGPLEGAPIGSSHNLTFYAHQIAEASRDRKHVRYNYAIGHLGMKWATAGVRNANAKVSGETISLVPGARLLIQRMV